jgi:CheY-like chemotaxis protein
MQLVTKKKKLLVLDDEADLRETYRSILLPQAAAPVIASSRRAAGAAPAGKVKNPELENLEVTFASNGTEAVQAVAKAMGSYEPFIGGFFDVRLGPGMDGIETIRQIKDMDPNLQCVIVTAYQDRNVEDITKIFGVEFSDRWDYLSKPFTSSEITQKAIHIIAAWSAREKEKQLLQQLDARQKREELIRELLEDILEKIRNQATNPQSAASPEQLKDLLTKISQLTAQGGKLLGEILDNVKAEFDKAA